MKRRKSKKIYGNYQEKPRNCSNKAPISACAASAIFSYYLPAQPIKHNYGKAEQANLFINLLGMVSKIFLACSEGKKSIYSYQGK